MSLPLNIVVTDLHQGFLLQLGWGHTWALLLLSSAEIHTCLPEFLGMCQRNGLTGPSLLSSVAFSKALSSSCRCCPERTSMGWGGCMSRPSEQGAKEWKEILMNQCYLFAGWPLPGGQGGKTCDTSLPSITSRNGSLVFIQEKFT
jgi:hypothetical protein